MRHVYDVKDPILAAVYVPALQEPRNDWKSIVLRGRSVSSNELDQAVASLGSERIRTTQSLEYIAGRALLRERITAMLATFFGGVALLLAAIGLYGLMSYAVTQRQREIGVRMALGADRRLVIRQVVSEGLAVALMGLAVGLVGVLASVRLVESLLFGVTTYDLTTLLAAPLVLLGTALAACLLPALRAASVDPIVTLRAE